jgi:hypothetical protein
MKTPHKHAELIKAWADGAEIEYFSNAVAGWRPTTIPNWADNVEFRIKPEPKPDVVRYGYFGCKAILSERHEVGYHNAKFTFDGETGKLKSAEVI